MYKIISGQYESGTAEQQEGYKQLFGEDNIQYKFDLYFHWYNIIHELGHCLVDIKELRETPDLTSVREEMLVNQFAVAYWKYIGREDKVKELEMLLNDILANIPSPVPNGREFTEYYESIWGPETFNSVILYGYFQLNSVLEAIRQNNDLRAVLAFMNIELTEDIVLNTYDDTICASNAHKVLNVALENLNKLEIPSLEVCLELVDNPMIQCAQEEVNGVTENRPH